MTSKYLAVLLFALVLATALANDNDKIYNVRASAHGKTYAEWAEEWWKLVLRYPADQNPAFDETGALCYLGAIAPSGTKTSTFLCSLFVSSTPIWNFWRFGTKNLYCFSWNSSLYSYCKPNR